MKPLSTWRGIAQWRPRSCWATPWVPLAAAADGSLLLAGGRVRWTGKFGDRINELEVAADGSRVALTHFASSVGRWRAAAPAPVQPAKGEDPPLAPPAPWPLPSTGIDGGGITLLDAAGHVLRATAPATSGRLTARGTRRTTQVSIAAASAWLVENSATDRTTKCCRFRQWQPACGAR